MKRIFKRGQVASYYRTVVLGKPIYKDFMISIDDIKNKFYIKNLNTGRYLEVEHITGNKFYVKNKHYKIPR